MDVQSVKEDKALPLPAMNKKTTKFDEVKSKSISLLPYLVIVILAIVFYRLSGEVHVVGNFVSRGWSIISPFFSGLLIAYVLNMPARALRKLLLKSKNDFVKRNNRPLSIIIVLLLLMGLTAVTLVLLIPIVTMNVSFFIANMPAYMDSIMAFIQRINEIEWMGLHLDTAVIVSYVNNAFGNFEINHFMQPINFLVDMGVTIFRGAIAAVSAIYFMGESRRLNILVTRIFNAIIPEKVTKATFYCANKMDTYFRQYIKVQSIDAIVLGVGATIVLLIIQSPFAIILGIMLGILNYIPYFGSIFGTIFAVLVVIVTQGFAIGIVAAVAILIIQQLDANVLQPALMSGSFKLSPLLVIISITVGGAISGILGMVIAIPIIATLKDIFDNFLNAREDKKRKLASKKNIGSKPVKLDQINTLNINSNESYSI